MEIARKYGYGLVWTNGRYYFVLNDIEGCSWDDGKKIAIFLLKFDKAVKGARLSEDFGKSDIQTRIDAGMAAFSKFVIDW